MEEVLRQRWGLDRPAYVRYFFWAKNFVTGDFGQSHDLGVPVREVLLSRLAGTVLVTVSALLFSWLVAFPIGLYSALRQYSAGDYFWTFAGFLGLSIPNFLLALMLDLAERRSPALRIDASPGSLMHRRHHPGAHRSAHPLRVAWRLPIGRGHPGARPAHGGAGLPAALRSENGAGGRLRGPDRRDDGRRHPHLRGSCATWRRRSTCWPWRCPR